MIEERNAKLFVELIVFVLMLLFLGLIKLFKGNFFGITKKNFDKLFTTFVMVLFTVYIIVAVVILAMGLK